VPIALALGPGLPRLSHLFHRGPEPSVIFGLRVRGQKSLVLRVPLAFHRCEEPPRERLENSSFDSHLPLIIDARKTAKFFDLFPRIDGLRRISSVLAQLVLRDVREANEELVPKEPACRRVGSRLKRLIQKCGEKRQGGHQAAALLTG